MIIVLGLNVAKHERDKSNQYEKLIENCKFKKTILVFLMSKISI